ncbi:Major pollen allergen Lol pI [Heracleum sosnowskyi]|uniref:Major pollen allergen Lol pI n=1 Tax=Heracleum sosnowskyi TaxID=360622 RepID=A0AAD8MJ98_9APIA|nr:Major pollen allergen Lol pI [Heracleum sosnowskyi]
MGCQVSHSFLLTLMVFLPALCYCQDTYITSRATYYGSPDCLGTPTGACGFAGYGRTINGGQVSGVSRLYRNGTGCGACYQVRCKSPKHCTDEGVKLVITDYGEGDHTDFILSVRAYSKLALPNMAIELFAYGVVDIEYKRISCQHPGYNLMFKVHEHSRNPEYLAVVPIYQAGINDITCVELWQEDCQEWRAMRHAYGAVWDMPNPPKGPLNLRFQVSGSYGEKLVQLRGAIPADWKAGVAYDTAIQLN